MKRRFWLSFAMLAAGASLIVAAGFASPGESSSSPQAAGKAAARGGTLRIDSRSDFDYVDPALSYFSHVWQVEYITQLRLMGFPDKEGTEGSRLRADAAAGFPVVSRDGKTYTFTIRKGFKFSNGQEVTARNYAYAINRALNPKMQSPGASFAEDILGAKAVLDNKAKTASGVKVLGKYKLQIKLAKVAPDFLARMSMPFFSAVPLGTPIIPEGIDAPVHSAGPYYIKEWVKKRSALIVRNPFWKGNQAPWSILQRPANVNAITYTFGNSLDATRLRIEKNEVDLGGIAPAAVAELVQKYGLNKGRFFIRKNLVFWYLTFNHDRPLFKGNTKLKQAINHAVDRPQLVRQHGFLGGGRTDQILPVGMPGYKNWNIYSIKGVNVTKAKALARGNTRGGKAVFLTFNAAHGPTVAQVVQFNLKQIGLDVEIQQLDRIVQHDKSSTRGAEFDITYEGWGADYPDPSNFINVLLDGRRIQATNNVNVSYFNEPKWNQRMEVASRLSGAERYRAYGILDRDLMAEPAPMAPFINTNARIFVSERVGCYNFQPVYGSTNLAAVCIK